MINFWKTIKPKEDSGNVFAVDQSCAGAIFKSILTSLYLSGCNTPFTTTVGKQAVFQQLT